MKVPFASQCLLLALLGPREMSDLSPQSRSKRILIRSLSRPLTRKNDGSGTGTTGHGDDGDGGRGFTVLDLQPERREETCASPLSGRPDIESASSDDRF